MAFRYHAMQLAEHLHRPGCNISTLLVTFQHSAIVIYRSDYSKITCQKPSKLKKAFKQLMSSHHFGVEDFPYKRIICHCFYQVLGHSMNHGFWEYAKSYLVYLKNSTKNMLNGGHIFFNFLWLRTTGSFFLVRSFILCNLSECRDKLFDMNLYIIIWQIKLSATYSSVNNIWVKYRRYVMQFSFILLWLFNFFIWEGNCWDLLEVRVNELHHRFWTCVASSSTGSYEWCLTIYRSDYSPKIKLPRSWLLIVQCKSAFQLFIGSRIFAVFFQETWIHFASFYVTSLNIVYSSKYFCYGFSCFLPKFYGVILVGNLLLFFTRE
jgi:hypothetical protein